MKFLIASFLILSTSAAFARSCENEVLDAYIKAVPQNDWHALTGVSYSLKSGENDILLYGKKITFNYPVDTELLLASSEFMGGFGVEAIVVDADCKVLELFNVYTE
jgi:hypothetical protein